MVDLSQLPPPNVIATLDFESIYSAIKSQLLSLYPDAANVINLESEPIVKLLQAVAYRELLMRNAINAAARANLLAFATGADLDHKGAFYNLARLEGESDERYRARIQLRIAALAGNGTAEHYKLLAMTASANVRAASVASSQAGLVQVVLWLADLSKQANTTAQVQAAYNAPGGRPVGVQVSVSVAKPVLINITAKLWREASAPADLVSQLAAKLPGVIASYASLGRGVPLSWLTAQLQVAGIARVEFPDPARPAPLTPCAVDEYAVAGDIHLLDAGVA